MDDDHSIIIISHTIEYCNRLQMFLDPNFSLLILHFSSFANQFVNDFTLLTNNFVNPVYIFKGENHTKSNMDDSLQS